MTTDQHQSIHYLERRLQQELSLDIYRSIGAPIELWELQEQAQQFLDTTTPLKPFTWKERWSKVAQLVDCDITQKYKKNLESISRTICKTIQKR